MKKHFYLVCERYDEALELVKSALGDKLRSAGGFVSLDDGGSFSIFPAEAAVCREDYEGREFMKASPPVRHDTEAFREDGVKLLEEAQYYPFALLAYIGGFELVIPQFRSALSDIISSEQPTFAIMLSEKKTEELRCTLGLGDKLTAYADRLRSAVSADGNSICIEACASECGGMIAEWIAEFA